MTSVQPSTLKPEPDYDLAHGAHGRRYTNAHPAWVRDDLPTDAELASYDGAWGWDQ